MPRPTIVSNVAANSPATSSWANGVANAVNEVVEDIYGTTQLELPWARITGKPATFPATTSGAVEAQLIFGLSSSGGDAAEAARANHRHGTPPVPTPVQVGTVDSRTTPNTSAGGRKLYVGSSTPTGPAEGDVWVKGATVNYDTMSPSWLPVLAASARYRLAASVMAGGAYHGLTPYSVHA